MFDYVRIDKMCNLRCYDMNSYIYMGLFDNLYQFDWTARYPLEYYYNDGQHVIFDKYEIDMFGGIYNKKTDKRLNYYKIGNYDMTGLCDSSGKQRSIFVARAMVSTFHGRPPTIKHSTEHIDCTNKNNNIISELTWIDPSGQNKNRIQPEKLLIAYIIVRDDVEMTAKEWIKHLNDEKNTMGREYTESMILYYAQNKRYGFSYKVYENLVNEIWYKVVGSENKKGHWEISNQNRIARVSKHVRNVIDNTRFWFNNKHPAIRINGQLRLLHEVAFETYYPKEYAAKKPDEMILHKFDDKLDFRPHMLYIGNASKNQKDSHDNGCRDGTKTARMSCCSYINGVFEKLHESQDAAAKHLKTIGYLNASSSAIGKAIKALKKDKIFTKYGRTWSLA